MNEKKLNSIIKAYRILKQQHPDIWIIDCGNAINIDKAIKLAAKARNNKNEKHPHQHRIPPSKLNVFCDKILERKNQIIQLLDFSSLIGIIDTCKFKGIADLTVYDTALRLGNFLKIYPKKVYLHRGTKEGAVNLLGKINKRCITLDELPTTFRDNKLTASEIEDLLCIYKKRLKTL